MNALLLAPVLFLSAGLAAAQAVCPDPPDHAAELEAILSEIRAAPNERTARLLSDDLWAFWTDAPDAQAQELLDRGMALREGYAFLEAGEVFDRLVDYCPDYAEGYNQRAFASFLQRDYAAALWDLNRTLELNPRHVGALSGKAMTLLGMGRMDEGQAALRAALALNPWLSERALLQEPPGQPI